MALVLISHSSYERMTVSEDSERFLSSPEIPAIAQKLSLREPSVEVDPVARYDS